jgi:sirohydrochlorin cobaltochelatase
MLLSSDPALARAELEARLRTLLPPDYQDTYERIQPKPMRSAGLKFAPDGSVAWDEIWGSFCDLAMAGGPPHKGRLLAPATGAAPDVGSATQLDAVVAEVRRGIEMVTSMPCDPAPTPGWVRVECYSAPMAGWLLRAITMENVAARADGMYLDLPVSPGFRLEKEIKNVITVIAKTSHYWLEHMPLGQQRAIADLFARLERMSPLVAPAWPVTAAEVADCLRTAAVLAQHVRTLTGLETVASLHPGWLGVQCPDVPSAVWMTRALVCLNVLSRREETTLFVPVNAASDPEAARTWSAVGQIARLM